MGSGESTTRVTALGPRRSSGVLHLNPASGRVREREKKSADSPVVGTAVAFLGTEECFRVQFQASEIGSRDKDQNLEKIVVPVHQGVHVNTVFLLFPAPPGQPTIKFLETLIMSKIRSAPAFPNPAAKQVFFSARIVADCYSGIPACAIYPECPHRVSRSE